MAQTYAGLKGTFALMGAMSVLGLTGLALVIGRLRQTATDLTRRANALEGEVAERQGAEAALREREERYRHIINGVYMK